MEFSWQWIFSIMIFALANGKQVDLFKRYANGWWQRQSVLFMVRSCDGLIACHGGCTELRTEIIGHVGNY
jgi:hypothetical protein